MPDKQSYQVALTQLEASARVKPEDQVESTDVQSAPEPDPRGPEPDAGWFAAGG